MKSRKNIVPEADFAFVGETFSLRGEIAVQVEPGRQPFQAADLEAGREITRRELS